MSKMVKKRGKGSVAEIQENITNKLSRMDSNNLANSSEDLHGKEPIADEKIDKKKGRGASKLKMVSGQDKCKELECNEFGQPIGDNSVKYASFLGCMIKEFVPYTLDGWSDIDEEVKDRMWSCLQMTYKVEDWEKKTIFQICWSIYDYMIVDLYINIVRGACVGSVACSATGSATFSAGGSATCSVVVFASTAGSAYAYASAANTLTTFTSFNAYASATNTSAVFTSDAGSSQNTLQSKMD
ncbi:uncharacterized protein LOC122036299 [Zingiber officinale]|uniref:uncharacterized protein LOC122036299 n=1 Tax=Zingiber officinale TaxID=94328 RepID=UPI001C4AD4A4|nr:uncharacterized protein LOC122036299 [Zingiber officinale]